MLSSIPNLDAVLPFLDRTACTLPENIGRTWACMLGLLASIMPSQQKFRLQDDIDRVYHRFGKPIPHPISEILKRLFVHFTLNGYEMLRAPLFSSELLKEIISFEGWEHVEKALQGKNGLILVLPHLGNWEILGAAIAFRGLKVHSLVVGGQKNSELGSYINHLRSFSKIILHDREREGISIMRALKAGEIIAMIADQDGGERGIYGDFLKHWVSIPSGPANWSLRTGVPIIPVYCLRIGNSRHFRAKFWPPMRCEDGPTHEARMIARTKKIVTWMEEGILQNPHQYLWFYDRFKPRHEKHIAMLKRNGVSMAHGKMVLGSIPPTTGEIPVCPRLG